MEKSDKIKEYRDQWVIARLELKIRFRLEPVNPRNFKAIPENIEN